MGMKFRKNRWPTEVFAVAVQMKYTVFVKYALQPSFDLVRASGYFSRNAFVNSAWVS